MGKTANRCCGWGRAIAALLLAGVLQAQVRITCDRPEVPGREACTLTASAPEGTDPVWRWRLQGGEPFLPVFGTPSRNQVRFIAPPTRLGGTLTVVVEDAHHPSLCGAFEVKVVPNPRLDPGAWAMGDGFVPDSLTPSLAPFTGDPTASTQGPGLPQASKLCFCDEPFREAKDPALRRLNGCWIAAHDAGIQAFTLGGEPVPGPQALPPGYRGGAVAVLPPGGLCPPGAPHLVYSATRPEGSAPVPADRAARVLALDGEGRQRDVDLAGIDPAHGRSLVQDLALDRHGNLFLAFRGEPEIWRIGAAGGTARHARLPVPEHGSGAGGILAMALDPATGDLYAGAASGLYRVAPEGTVSSLEAVPGTCRPDHLALRGRELLIVDTRSHEVLALHLDHGRVATLLGSAGGHAPTRLGPLHGLNPGLGADRCAALGSVGPLAITGEGLGLLAVGSGFAMLDLPVGPMATRREAPVEEPKAPAPTPDPGPRRVATAAPTPDPGPWWVASPPSRARLTPKQRRLAHARALQLEIRACKRAQRAARLKAARDRADEEAVQAQLARFAAQPAPVAPSGPTRATPRRVLGGCCALVALGLGALSDPALLGALAQASVPSGTGAAPPPFIARSLTDLEAMLDRLGPACLAALPAGRSPAPCASGYRRSILAQAAVVQAETAARFVAPATLGAGACLPGDSRHEAKERIALFQSDRLAEFGILAADAGVLQNQLGRDGAALQTLGAGLLVEQEILMTAQPGPVATLAAFGLGQAGGSLIAAGFGFGAVSSLYGSVSSLAGSYQAGYQKWANSQGPVLLQNCTGVPAPTAPGPDAASAPDSVAPFSVLADAERQLAAGCALAARHALVLPVCLTGSLPDFGARNGTIAHLFTEIPCLASGVLAGDQAPCSKAPLGEVKPSRIRSDTFATFDAFAAELGAASGDAFAVSNGLFAGSVGLMLAGSAAELAGNLTQVPGLATARNSLIAIGYALEVDGYDLLRLAAWSRRVRAEVTLAFNTESRARMAERKARRLLLASGSSSSSSSSSSSGSGTGSAAPGPLSSTAPLVPAERSASSGRANPNPPEVPPADEGPAPTGSSLPDASTGPQPSSANAATRNRPWTLGEVVRLLLPAPPVAAPVHGDF